MNKLPPEMQLIVSKIMPLFLGPGVADYSIDSLATVEQRINELYPPGHQPLNTTVLAFGMYLGEVLLKNIPNAKWSIDERRILDAQIVIKKPGEQGDVFSVLPIRRVGNFWQDRTDCLHGWAIMVRDLASGELDPEALPDGWQPYKGSKIRVTTVKMEDLAHN